MDFDNKGSVISRFEEPVLLSSWTSEILPMELVRQQVGREIPDSRRTGREFVGTVMDS